MAKDSHPTDSPMWLRLLGYPWSVAVGASVAACGIFSTQVNSHYVAPADAPEGGIFNLKDLHSIYPSTLALLFGGCLLLPAALMEKKPWGKPTKWYSLMGGVFLMIEFLTIPAFTYVGVQIVLLAMLLGMLSMGMVFDCKAGTLKADHYRKYLGFIVVMLGVVLDYFGPMIFLGEGGEEPMVTLDSLPWVGAAYACGVLYALMAKANTQLAKDMNDSAARATVICAVVAVIARVPLIVWICWGKDVAPTLDFGGDWAYWLAAAAQSAFYNASMAMLPGLLGYTANYIVMLIGKLGFSSVIDAMGWAGKTIPFDWIRVVSEIFVIIGTMLFAVKSWRQLFKGVQTDKDESDESTSASDDGTDVSEDSRADSTDREDYDILAAPTGSLVKP